VCDFRRRTYSVKRQIPKPPEISFLDDQWGFTFFFNCFLSRYHFVSPLKTVLSGSLFTRRLFLLLILIKFSPGDKADMRSGHPGQRAHQEGTRMKREPENSNIFKHSSNMLLRRLIVNVYRIADLSGG